ncbi:hypothetical protein [Endozoicomonas sp. 8E]|uniref:hypothetical protein n=1 Tax=Endozoicomonas sp. 8E TaxID=3035692 RepID=UPI0029390A74|nr:hypothetical protein [Endozoicomonas sp. 8E]WOG27051.1 hypothetical protein P6910_21250 [Endozoicomonas sp. 8E]
MVCQPETLTRRFIFELQQDTGFLKQNFSIKSVRHIWPGSPSDIVDTNGYPGSDSQPDDTRHRPGGYRVKTTITNSISWQWLYATNLPVAYELILTSKNAPLSSSPYSWPPVELFIAFGWYLKNYWCPDSKLFSPIEQQETSPTLTRLVQLFAAITTMFSSEHNAQQYQPSGSSGQQASQTTSLITNSFTLLLNTDYRDGSDYPKGDLHTLGFNCFVHPCRGVCRFRSSSNSRGPAELPLNSEENSTDDTELIPGQSSCPHLATGYCFSCLVQTDPLNTADIQQNSPFETLIQFQYDSDPLFMPEICSIDGVPTHNCKPIDRVASDGAASDGIASDSTGEGKAYTIDPVGCTNSVVRIDGEDGQQRPCKMLCKNVWSFSVQNYRAQSKKKTCEEIVIGWDLQLQPCGVVCKTSKSLALHKRKEHTGQQVCDAIVVEEDGQQRPCGKVFRNVHTLLNHRSRIHSGQKNCDLTIIGEDGQQRTCGAVCKNARAFWDHKSKAHSKQKICDAAILEKNGQLRPCGTVCKNIRAFWDHKYKIHTGQKTCDVTVTSEDDQPRPCGAVCKNSQVLSDHKRSVHSSPKICDVTVVGADGQSQPCGKACKSVGDLANHKRKHRNNKPVGNKQENDHGP